MPRYVLPWPLLTLLLLSPVVRAEPIWGYRSPTNTSVLTPGQPAGLTFPNTPWTDAPDGGRVMAAPVVSWSAATALSPDRVEGEFYTFGLEVKDYASGATGTVEFGGLLAGDLWKDGTSLTNTFAGPTAQALELGLNRYTVALDAFEAPTGFGEAGAGRITADVTVTPLGDPEPTAPPDGEQSPTAAQTPEPSAIVLGVIALGATGLHRLRRRPR